MNIGDYSFFGESTGGGDYLEEEEENSENNPRIANEANGKIPQIWRVFCLYLSVLLMLMCPLTAPNTTLSIPWLSVPPKKDKKKNSAYSHANEMRTLTIKIEGLKTADTKTKSSIERCLISIKGVISITLDSVRLCTIVSLPPPLYALVVEETAIF
jgi:hypothetical protein